MMIKKVYNKYGDVNDLKNIINKLFNFSGIIKIDTALLFYKDSKLIKVLYNGKDDRLENVINVLKLKKGFVIEVYECNNIYEIINKNNILDILNLEVGGYKILNSLSSLLNLPDGSYKIIPKRFKDEFGYVKISNKKIVYSAYITKNKVLTKNMALAKIKTLFAVSNILVEKVDEKILKKYDGYLFKVYSLNELISKIKSKGYKKAYGSLKDVLTEEPSLIEVGEGYIVSKAKKPIYAFYKDFDGNKALRYLKSLCIVEDIEFKIYPLDEEEYKAFSLFSKNRVIQ